ncbi:hypothetical protein [Hydrogenophaga sp.]|uniref:hypothetical protein n=1 Tax=Hydrogenophaga sp. TaxID=1904254 RepID=UPI00391A621C
MFDLTGQLAIITGTASGLGVQLAGVMAEVALASEIKGTALYLALAASSFTTSLLLVTDGGCMAK